MEIRPAAREDVAPIVELMTLLARFEKLPDPAPEVVARLEAEARARGCGRFEWLVLDWNRDARTLYESHGARSHDAWRLYRVEL